MKLLQKSKRIISLGVATALLLSVTVVGSVYAQSGEDAAKTITAFSELDEAVAKQSAPLGQTRKDLNLPETLEGTVSFTAQLPAGEDLADSGAVTQTTTERIPLEWTSSPEYNGDIIGEYVFSAAPTGGYVVGAGVALPEITITVHEPLTMLRSAAKMPITTNINCYGMDTTDKLATEGWKWNSISSTLTLDGLDLTVNPGVFAISMPADGTIVLAPGSVNNITYTSPDINESIHGLGNLVITGSGTLNIDAKMAISTAMEGYIRIDGGTLNLNGDISNSNGNIIFNGGTVTINTTGSYGVRNNCHTIQINGGTLSVTAANAAIATLDVGGRITVGSGMTVTDGLSVQTAQQSGSKPKTSFVVTGETLGFDGSGFTNAAKSVTISGEDNGVIPPAAVYDIAVKSPPAKTAYVAGDTLDLSGMVISLERNDGTTEEVASSSFGAKGIITIPEHGAVLTTANSSVTVMFDRLYDTQAITVSAKDGSGTGDGSGDNPGGNPGNNPGGGGSTGGSTGGGSGSSGGGTTNGGIIGSNAGRLGGAAGNADRRSSNVSISGEVKSSDAVRQATKAVEESTKAGSAEKADVVVKNARSVSAKTLKEMDAAAKKAGGGVQLVADSVVNGKTQARLYIDPALSTALKSDIKLGVKLDNRSTGAVRKSFAGFDNELAIIGFEHQGSFGMPLEAAVKVNLDGLDEKNLRFYSYDKASNRYSVIANPEYRIDSNGFLHFKTSAGGDVLISDKPLTPKR